MMANAIIKTADFLGELLNKLLLVPGKAIFNISIEYMKSNNFSFISIIGVFLILILISFVVKYVAILLKDVVEGLFILHDQRKRAQIREIQRKEREKTISRIADNQAFDEMYEAYAADK